MNIDKAVRYHRLKRRAAVATTLLAATLLVTLLISGGSASLRDLAALGTPQPESLQSSPRAIALYVMALWIVWQLSAMPLTYYSAVILERRYGLSAESTARWARHYVKAALVSIVLSLAAAEALYFAIRHLPNGWWIASALGFGTAFLVLVRIAPVALFPIFYRFTPLDRPELQERLRALTVRAGLPVVGVYEWGLGEQTRRANAALVGVGATRRILLSDTLLAGYSDDEIEVILAHELAHHAHRDVLNGVVVQSAVLFAGLGTTAWVIHTIVRDGGWMGIRGAADIAALPLMLLVVGGISLALTPFTHALSRFHERRADAYALRLTERPGAFISAMRRLGAQNLAEPNPSRAAVWLFHSHPPIQDRIASAESPADSPRQGR